MANILVTPTPHKEAAKFIATKPIVSRSVFDRLLPELRARAFVISGIEAANVLQDTRDAIATLPEGGDWNEIKKGIVADIDPYFVDPAADAETQAAQQRAAERRAELLIRTHGQQAYSAAAYNVADEQRDLFPFWQYQTLGDTHVRDTHAALDGIVLPHDHPFWAHHTPPWDWGCRCQFIPLSEADVDELRIADAALPPERRRVLDDAAQKLLAEGRTIHRDLDGNGARPYYIGSAFEDGQPGAFHWHPGDLRLSVEDLKARYDEQTWGEFEAWAKSQPLQDLKLTVWEWLHGAVITPASPATLPPVQPASADALLAQLGLAGTTQWTDEQVGSLLAALKKPSPVKIGDKLTGITGALSKGAFSESKLRAAAQELLDMLPRDVALALPQFSMRIVGHDSALGTYSPASKVLTLNRGKLLAHDVKSTLWHEMMHWIHMHGPQSYRDAVRAHFRDRTKNEPTAPLPIYGSPGRRDKWWDAYIGRIYASSIDSYEGEGLELPTRSIQWLSDPAKLRAKLNPLTNPNAAHFIETFKVALSIFIA